MDYEIPHEIRLEMSKKAQEHTTWMEGNITVTFEAFLKVFSYFYLESMLHGMGHGYEMAAKHFAKMENEHD
jgi:hypothetical protein